LHLSKPLASGNQALALTRGVNGHSSIPGFLAIRVMYSSISDNNPIQERLGSTFILSVEGDAKVWAIVSVGDCVDFDGSKKLLQLCSVGSFHVR